MRVKRERQGFAYALRGAAALLLTASLLCAFGVQAMAAGMPVASPVAVNKPAVTVEGNAVVDGNGKFTGFFELALKVRTTFYYDNTGAPTTDPAKIDDSKTVSHPFRSAAVALRYDTTLLTPVSWSYTQEDYVTNKPGIDVSGASSISPVELETKKPDTGFTAAAQVEDYIAADANNSDRSTALLTLSAESGGTNVFYENETVVCVVRFKYDLTRLVMNQTDSYQFLRPKGTPTGAGTATQSCVVWFAEDDQAADSTVGQSVRYQGMQSRTAVTDKDKTYLYYYLKAPTLVGGLPDTVGLVVFSEAVAGTKNYTTNLLEIRDDKEPGALAFRLVNNKSYANGGVNVDSLATILFYDWDNTLINVLTVEKGDVRAAVNAHVEKTMIHPDLRASTHPGADYMDSLDRLYTYRGKYPAEGPSGSTTVTNGDKYVLTNKLDYAPYRRPTTLEEDVPGDPNTTKHWEVTNNASATTDAYPYANGWAVVADIKNIENIWTTFGVGELKDIDPADPSGKYVTQGTAADYFELLDFSNLDAGVYYVKACYEPGTSLNRADYYTVTKEPTYTRYDVNGSTDTGSAYSIKFQYGRINNDYGVIRTRNPSLRVSYFPDIKGTAADAFYLETPTQNVDVMDIELTPSGAVQYMQYVLIDAYSETFVTGEVRSTNGNEANLLNNFNYTDHLNPNHQGSEGFVYRATLNQMLELGTEAVLINDAATFNATIKSSALKDLNLRYTDTIEFEESAIVSLGQTRILDAIRKAYDYGIANPASKLVVDGVVNLDWHQIQYHLINYSSGGMIKGDGSVRSVAECGSFAWCRLDTCAESVTVVINNLSDLIVAARKANNGAIPATQQAAQKALDTLDMDWVNAANGYAADATALRLRGGKAGDKLADLAYINNADFVTRLKAFVAAADAAGDGLTNIDDVWYQLQHALVNGGTYAPIGGVPVDDYWWKTKDNKPMAVDITDIPTLLQAAKEFLSGSTIAWNKLNMSDVETVLRLYGSSTGDVLADLTTLTDATAFKTAIQDLVTAAGADYSTLTWYQVQDYLLKKALNDDAKISRYLYWWKDKDQKLPVTLENLLDTVVEVMDTKVLSAADFGYWTTLAVIDTPWDDPDDPADLFGLGFRADNAGTHYTGATISTVPTKLRQMFARAKTAGYYDDTNKKLNLSWDQVQYYLINGAIVDDTTAQGQRYAWRPGGTGSLPVTITSFEELLLAAKQANEGDSTSLDSLTTAFANGQYFRLADGVLLSDADLALVKAAAKNAVKFATDSGGDYKAVTWEQVQYAILNSTGTDGATASTESAAKYWWKAGGTKVTDWPSLIAAAKDAAGGITARLNTVALSQVNSLFYLVMDENGTGFTSIEAFKGLITDAVVAAGGNYLTMSWEQAQYYIINVVMPSAGSATAESNAKYWWRDGGQEVTDIPTLLAAIKAAQGGIPAQLNTLSLTELNHAPLYLRTNSVGGEFTALADATNKLSTLVTLAGADYASLTWDQVQYYLVKGSYVDDSVAAPESLANYWWKAGGSKPVVKVTLEELNQKIVAVMVDKTMSAADFGLWLNTTILNDDLGFRKNVAGDLYTDGDVAGAATKFRQMFAKAKAGYYDAVNNVLNLTWDQIQYYIIKAAIVTPAAAAAENYAWKPAWASTMSIEEAIEQMEGAEEPVVPEIPDELPAPPPVGPDVPVAPPTEEPPAVPEEPVVPETPDVGGGIPDAPPAEPPVEPEKPAVPEEPTDPPAEEPAVPETPDIPPEEVPDTEEIPQSVASSGDTAQTLASPERGGPPEGLLLPFQGNSPPAPIGAEGYIPTANNPAALPPPDPRTFYYRRTLRRKKTMCPANRGGINL